MGKHAPFITDIVAFGGIAMFLVVVAEVAAKLSKMFAG